MRHRVRRVSVFLRGMCACVPAAMTYILIVLASGGVMRDDSSNVDGGTEAVSVDADQTMITVDGINKTKG